MNELIVTATSGKTVNLRIKPSKGSMIIDTVPIHTKVELVNKFSDEWYEIKYKNHQGYMMAQFLKSSTSNKLSQEDIREVYNSLKETLTLLEKLL